MADQTQGFDAQLLVLLGEIKGELGGIRSQIKDTTSATNSRIDDLSASVKAQTAAINRRIDDHKEDVDQRFNSVELRLEKVIDTNTLRRNTILTSGGVAGSVTAMAEVIKALVN